MAAKVNALLRAADDERRQATAHRAPQQARGRGEGLAGLKVEMAAVEGKHRTVEADLGPVCYLATLRSAKDDDVLRYFILVIALLLDPAAVLLRWRRHGHGTWSIDHAGGARRVCERPVGRVISAADLK
jgi:hypothetical protein